MDEQDAYPVFETVPVTGEQRAIGSFGDQQEAETFAAAYTQATGRTTDLHNGVMFRFRGARVLGYKIGPAEICVPCALARAGNAAVLLTYVATLRSWRIIYGATERLPVTCQECGSPLDAHAPPLWQGGP
jgi:hypothetical protein